jgi:hypothetical protein
VDKIEKRGTKESRYGKEEYEGARDDEFVRECQELHENFIRKPHRKDCDLTT